jgi:ribosome-binding factor A
MKRVPRSVHRYPRTVRLNELIREIVADELERIGDDNLEHIAITGVDVEADLRRAVVWFDTFGGPDEDDIVIETLGEYRVRLQSAIGRQARAKRTPLLTFRPDIAIRAGERIDAVLRDVEERDDRSS